MVDAVLYGTPPTCPRLRVGLHIRTEGNFGFQGLALDAYLDCEIRFLARDGEMIAMRELVSEDVVYENIWLAETDGRSFKAYLGTAYREFPVSGKLGMFQTWQETWRTFTWRAAAKENYHEEGTHQRQGALGDGRRH